MAARALAKAIGDKGKVYVSNVKPGISTTDQREEGFKAEMAENFPNVEVLETQFNDNDANKAASQLQAVFARNPDLKGVFGANLFSALGAGNGVQQAGQSGKIRVVAFDAPHSIVDNIKTGLVDVAIAQHPAEIGYFGVVSAFAHLTGNSIPTAIGTGFTVIDKANVDDPERRQVHLLRLIRPASLRRRRREPRPRSATPFARAPRPPRPSRGLTMTAKPQSAPAKPPADQHAKPQADHAERAKTLVQRIADLRAWLFLAALIVVFETWARLSFGGTFILNPFNLQSIAIFAVAPLLLATGQTFVIISGGIDLSIGFIMGLAAVVAAHVINATSPAVGLAGGVLVRLHRRRADRLHPGRRQRPAGLAPAGAALHRHARHVRRRPRRRLPARRRHDGAGPELALRRRSATAASSASLSS